MDYLRRLRDEVATIARTFGTEPERPLPRSVEVSDSPASIHATSSLTDEGSLLISRDLLQYVDRILRKEALSLFIPPEADNVPQVHDLAWAYSGVPAEIWDSVRIRPPRPFTRYDPILLFSLLPRASRLRVMGGALLYVKASARRGQLTLPHYLHILNRFFGMEVKLTEAERRIVGVLSLNPYASTREIKEEARVSEASISRSLRRLRKIGVIFGPQNVRLWKLDMVTVVASFPNVRRLREAFWGFPFTYTQFIPVSGQGRVHAYLVLPRPALSDLIELRKAGIELGLARRTVQRFNLTPPEDPLMAMVRAYLGTEVSEQAPAHGPEPLPIRLSRRDIEILNHVMMEGRITSSALSERGIRSAKQRLGRLRSSGLIGNFYMVELPLGHEIVLFRISCPPGEAERLTAALSSVTTVALSYVEGDASYCLAVTFPTRELRSDLIKGIKSIYGDDVELAEDVMDIRPTWLMPEDLWDERRQTFRWERPLEKLISALRERM